MALTCSVFACLKFAVTQMQTLELIFKSCTESGKFSIEWKKANVAPVE